MAQSQVDWHEALKHDPMKEIWQKFLADPKFRQEVLDKPEETLTAAGFTVPHEMIERFKHADRRAVEQAIKDAEDGKNGTC
jgi:hypothetical protein